MNQNQKINCSQSYDPEERLTTQAQKSLAPAAALLLYELMSELSEKAFCAGWITGNELSLWNILTTYKSNKPCNYGWLTITQEIVEQLRSLSCQCGGWWCFDDELGEVFMAFDEWQQIYAKQLTAPQQ